MFANWQLQAADQCILTAPGQNTMSSGRNSTIHFICVAEQKKINGLCVMLQAVNYVGLCGSQFRKSMNTIFLTVNFNLNSYQVGRLR